MISYIKNTTKFGKKLKITSTKKFGSEPVYNDKDLKAKVKSYNGKTIKYQKKVVNLFAYR